MKDFSYALGLNIGQQLKEMGLNENFCADEFGAAVADVLANRTPRLSLSKTQSILNDFFTKLNEKQEAAAKNAKADGEQFLAENAKKPGITVTSSGLQYEVLTLGSGRRPKASDQVRCHYHGTLIDGTVFDSSYRRNEPCVFGLRQVIAGWTEGVQLMPVGSKFRFYIPYHLAYGEQGAGQSIPPYAALIFDVELLDIL